MSLHSVADAKSHLSALIDRALAGEDVVITRHGHAVVELRPIHQVARAVTDEDIDWLDAHRVECAATGSDAGRLLSEMRDEEWR